MQWHLSYIYPHIDANAYIIFILFFNKNITHIPFTEEIMID